MSTLTRHADPIDKIVAEIIAEAELSASVKLRRVDPALADAADAIFDRLTKAQDEEAAKPTVRRHRKVDLDGAALALAEERTALLITGGNLIDACLDIAELGVVVARQVAGAEAAARMAGIRPPQAQLPPPPPPDDDDDDTLRDIHERATERLPKVHVNTLRGNQPTLAVAESDPDPDIPYWKDDETKAVRVGGWWRRLLQRGRLALAGVALILQGVA